MYVNKPSFESFYVDRAELILSTTCSLLHLNKNFYDAVNSKSFDLNVFKKIFFSKNVQVYGTYVQIDIEEGFWIDIQFDGDDEGNDDLFLRIFHKTIKGMVKEKRISLNKIRQQG